jgi:hypothetical protein
MNVLTVFQNALITNCIITRISYLHTQNYACVDVLPNDTFD